MYSYESVKFVETPLKKSKSDESAGEATSGGEASGGEVGSGETLLLPMADIGRIMKKALKALPGGGDDDVKIDEEAIETVQECATEFIHCITSQASLECQKNDRQIVLGDDILDSLRTFNLYAEALERYLGNYRSWENMNGSIHIGEDDGEPKGEEEEEITAGGGAAAPDGIMGGGGGQMTDIFDGEDPKRRRQNSGGHDDDVDGEVEKGGDEEKKMDGSGNESM